MGILALRADERVNKVRITKNMLSVTLKDGRIISVPLLWYPKLFEAKEKERLSWQICGGGYGIHWPKIDEDLSTEGLLRGAPAPSYLSFKAGHLVDSQKLTPSVKRKKDKKSL